MSPNHECETGDGDVSSVEMVLDDLVYMGINLSTLGGQKVSLKHAAQVEGYGRKVEKFGSREAPRLLAA